MVRIDTDWYRSDDSSTEISTEVGTIPSTFLRQGDWKLIRFHGDGEKGADRFELYNLKKDPNESEDLASKKTVKCQEMIDLLRPFYAEVRQESVTWPAWQWPHWEGKRIQQFVDGLSK